MSTRLTFDAIVRSMTDLGIPHDVADRQARHECGLPAANHVVAVEHQPLTFPIRITLPWTALCPDNERETAGLTMRGGKPFPRKVMTARYRAARDRIIPIARAAMTIQTAPAPPLDVPLALVARVYVPTQRRVDVANFAKGVHDALSKIVYTDDQWLWDVRWVRVGMDIDAPRVELEIQPC